MKATKRSKADDLAHEAELAMLRERVESLTRDKGAYLADARQFAGLAASARREAGRLKADLAVAVRLSAVTESIHAAEVKSLRLLLREEARAHADLVARMGRAEIVAVPNLDVRLG